MSRATDIIAGAIIGGLVWVILDFILSPIPILGWIIAAILAGYVAGRLGGGWAGLILALFTPVASFLLGEAILSYSSGIISSYMPAITPLWNMIAGFLGATLAAYSMVSAIVNLIFVGIGASLGASSYNKSKKGAEKRNVKVSAKRNVPTANFVVQSRYGVAKPSVNSPSYVSSPSISVSSLSGLDRLIVERFRAGASLEQIAREAGVDIIEVQNRFIGLMDKGLVDLQLNQLELRILESAKSGINVREIAEQTGVGEETINWEINKLKTMTLLDNNLKLMPLGYHILIKNKNVTKD